MSVHALKLDEQSPFLGESCALCKQIFNTDDEIVICPEDATRHHPHCWQANNNHCTAYGCGGQGVVVDESFTERRQGAAIAKESSQGKPFWQRGAGFSKVKTLGDVNFSCAQSCLLIMIGVAILLFALGCFGLWAIFDYLLIEVFDLPYREPLSTIPWGYGRAVFTALL